MSEPKNQIAALPEGLEPMTAQELAERNAPPLMPAASAITPMEMIQTALQNGAGVDMLEKLMGLQERWERNEARKAFDRAIAAARREIKPIVKTAEVDFTSQKGRTHYKHETLDGIAAQVDPILGNYGLSYRFRSKQDGNLLTVTCIVAHEGGHFEETALSGPPDQSGNKNPYQGVGSAATYLQRYTLKLALGLSAAKDDDAQNAGGQDDTPPRQRDGLDDMYQKRCQAAAAGLRRETTLVGLVQFWTDLNKNEPRVAHNPGIIKVKDECKAALEKAQNVDLGESEIPY